MPSPFPGMNPWLEQDALWHDFHQRLLTAMSDAIAIEISPRYYVALEEHVYIHEPPEPRVRFLGRPDLAIVRMSDASFATATAVMEAPVYTAIPEPMDVVSESFIEIRDTENESLVTVLELLSPSNKQAGYDRDAYIAKRRHSLLSDVNFIEIDLLRGGPRMPIEELSPCDYYVLVKRASERTRAGVWPIRLRDCLPTIPIPLRAPDPDARLDLQAVLHDVYDRAGYRHRIYRGTPKPKLVADDAQWADAILTEHLTATSPDPRPT